MAKLTATYEIDQFLFQVGRYVVVKRTRLPENVFSIRAKFDLFYEVYTDIWSGPNIRLPRSTWGHKVAKCRSEAEALHYIEGTTNGAFVSIPLPDEFDYDPALESFVEQGA